MRAWHPSRIRVSIPTSPLPPARVASLPRMSAEAGELLGIDPIELRFPCTFLVSFFAGSFDSLGISVVIRGGFDGAPRCAGEF